MKGLTLKDANNVPHGSITFTGSDRAGVTGHHGDSLLISLGLEFTTISLAGKLTEETIEVYLIPVKRYEGKEHQLQDVAATILGMYETRWPPEPEDDDEEWDDDDRHLDNE